jgi:hypothetical protein
MVVGFNEKVIVMSDSKILKYKERLKSLKSKSLSELKSILKTQLRIVSTSGYGKDTAISEILENEFGSKFMNEINSKEKSSDNITARTVLEKFGKNKSEGGKTPLKVIQPYKIHANEITEKGDHYEVTYSTSVNHNKAIVDGKEANAEKRGKKLTADEREMLYATLAANCTTGWEGMELDGSPPNQF